MAYTLTASKSTVQEGDSVIFSLNGTGLPNGTLVPFKITGANVNTYDYTGISGLTGNFVIQNDKSQIKLNLVNDLRTEGNETLVLSLTGAGRTESIGIIISDTSQTPSGNIAEFFIKPDVESLYEGQTVTFNITGKYVSVGTVVPYTISGIQNADVYNIPVSGNITFAANSTYDTVANVKLQLLEDNIAEGDENIVFLLDPPFPYSLELNGTAIVYDSSTTASKRLRVSSNKQKVVEGGNITFTLSADNIKAGTNVNYRIIPWTSWDVPNELFPESDLNANDFVGLSSFYGKFPPLYEPQANATTNVSSITFVTKDDFIFEPSEYFYLGVYTDEGLSSGSGIVEIQDSGNSYLKGASTSGDVIVSFLETANLQPNIRGVFTKLGTSIDSTGQLSNYNVLQGRSLYATEDSPVFYQPFSYVIRSKRSIDEWQTSVKNVLHPAGFALFGEINNETSLDNINYAGINIQNETEIYTFSSVTVDTTKQSLNVSNVTIAGSINLPLTADIVSFQTNPQ